MVHDWGGGIGMGWATRHPERVRRLVVFNSAAWLAGRAPRRIAICRSSLVGGFLVRRLKRFRAGSLALRCGKARAHDPGRAGGIPSPRMIPTPIAWPCTASCRDIPVDPSVPSHSVLQEMDERLPLLADKPMLICWGDKDFCFTPHFLEGWRMRFPRAKVHRFPDAGHYLLEDDHEGITPIVHDFLTQ